MYMPISRREFAALATSISTFPLPQPTRSSAANEHSWSVNADVAESCSCPIPCPCNFGNPVKHCDASRLIQIREGHVDGADLTGISFVLTFSMGEWSKFYVSDRISHTQKTTFEKFLPFGFRGFHGMMRTLEYVPLEVDRTATSVEFSVPESSVVIEMVRGIGGKPITIDGLLSSSLIG